MSKRLDQARIRRRKDEITHLVVERVRAVHHGELTPVARTVVEILAEIIADSEARGADDGA